MAVITNPGVSIVGIDPGGTTGVAVWDAWDKCWYLEQLDAGTGFKYREYKRRGYVESEEHQRVATALGIVRKGRLSRLDAKNDMRILHVVESGVTQALIDRIVACGPGTVVVMEDFVLWNERNTTSGREGLSPLRILSRLMERMEVDGVLNGDIWRTWMGFGSAGKDRRGVVVPNGVRSYPERLAGVRAFNENGEDPGVERGVLWRGGGAHWMLSSPSQKPTVPDAFLKGKGLWWPNHQHAMDAMKHAVLVMRRIGVVVPTEVKRMDVRARKGYSSQRM